MSMPQAPRREPARDDRGDPQPDLQLDLQLARTAAGGDRQAWRAIYDQTCDPLFNFLCWQTGDRDTARDLLQETYITALDRLGSFRGQGTLLGWLRAIALRKCLDWRRRLQHRMRKLTAFAQEQSSLAETAAQEALPGLGDEFKAALDRLSPRQRAALLLRELEDLPFSAVAEQIGCSEATARVHHHRACRNLQQWLRPGHDLVFGADAGGMLS